MIPSHCLNSLKPGDQIYIDGNIECYTFIEKHKFALFKYDQEYGYIISVSTPGGDRTSIFEKFNHFDKIIKHK